MTVVDASVAVKWYIPERHHDAARDLRDDYLDGDHDLSAPQLLPFEVVNALRYSGHYEGERLQAAARSLGHYGLDLLPFRAISEISAVAEALDVTIYDASYVALAEHRDTVGYTSDEALVADVSGSKYDGRIAHVREYPG